MKKYCLNCGYGSEYLGMPPEKCEKCKESFGSEFKDLIAAIDPNFVKKSENGKTVFGTIQKDGHVERGLPDSEFDSFMEEEPEPLSADEIAGIFLADAHQGINLRDLVQKNKKTSQPKPKTRKKNK